MAKKSNAKSGATQRRWDPPAELNDARDAAYDAPDPHDDEYDDEGYYDPLGKSRREKAAREAASAPDTPPWDDEPQPAPKAASTGKRPAQSKSAAARKTAPAKGRASGGAKDDMARTRPGRTGGASRAAERDDRPTLTVQVSGEGNEQFDVLVDGEAYWGGDEPPYQFEMKLSGGEHMLRVRQRHAMDKLPSEYIPLPLAVLVGDGRASEVGPYQATIDMQLNVTGDSKLSVKYALTGRTGANRGRAAFTCSSGKGLDCEVLDTSMSGTPPLRRRWRAINYLTLAVMSLLALSVVALGAFMAVRPGGSVGGGISMAVIGTALAMGCASIASTLRTALDGGFAPDIDFPKAKKRARQARDDASDAGPQYGAGDDAPAAKPAKRKKTAKGGKRAAAANDYDGAYDDAGEMTDFESSGLSTAELTPEQLRAAKKQLIRKLGGEEEEEN